MIIIQRILRKTRGDYYAGYKDGKLKAEKTVNNPAPKLGEEVEYRITFRNVVEHGKVAKVKIKDELPTGLEFVEGSERAEERIRNRCM